MYAYGILNVIRKIKEINSNSISNNNRVGGRPQKFYHENSRYKFFNSKLCRKLLCNRYPHRASPKFSAKS